MGGHNNITDLDSYDNNNFEFSVIHLVINAIFKFFFCSVQALHHSRMQARQ